LDGWINGYAAVVEDGDERSCGEPLKLAEFGVCLTFRTFDCSEADDSWDVISRVSLMSTKAEIGATHSVKYCLGELKMHDRKMTRLLW